MTPSVKASTFEASCELFTVARVARRRLRNGFFMLPYMEYHDQTRRSDTVAVPGTLDVTITAPVTVFSMSTVPFDDVSTPATHSRNDTSQFCQCRNQHAARFYRGCHFDHIWKVGAVHARRGDWWPASSLSHWV